MGVKKGIVVFRHSGDEVAERAGDDPVAEFRLLAITDFRPLIEFLRRFFHPPVDALKDPLHVHCRVDVELGGEPDFHVPNPLGLIIPGELIADPLQILRGLHRLDRIGEGLEAVSQITILFLEKLFVKPLHRVGGKLDIFFSGDLD